MYTPLVLIITVIIVLFVTILIFYHKNIDIFGNNKNSIEITPYTQNCVDGYFDMIVCICIPERKQHMLETFKQWGIKNVSFFNAYLKKDYNHQRFIDIGFLDPNYDSYLNVGRICCHYSAISVYTSFVNSEANTLLVFEDDLRKDTYENLTDFNNSLCPVLKHIPQDWEYLNFSKCYDLCSKNEEIGNPYWNIPVRPLCRTAIALKKKAAGIILNKTIPMKNDPGDRTIGNLVKNKSFKAYATKNVIFFQHKEKFGTTLDNNEKTNPRMCVSSFF